MVPIVNTVQQELSQWGSQLIGLLPNIGLAILIIILSFITAKYARRVVRHRVQTSSVKNTLTTLIATTTYTVIIGIGVFFALETIQLDKAVTSLLAGAGIIGLALAFAFQDIASNFVSGLILATKDIFSVGDLIETGDHFGEVKKIDLRTTQILIPSGQTLMIPNSEILSNPLKNYSETGQRRVDIACGVGYDDDLDEAKRVVRQAVKDCFFVDPDSGIDIFYDAFGGSSMNFTIRFWIDFQQSNKAYLSARSEAIMSIKKSLDENGFDIPYPIRTIKMNDSTTNALQRGE